MAQMIHACGNQIHNHSAGGLKAVAQIEDGAVGLGMTTFVSPINSVTSHQKVSCPDLAACLQLFLWGAHLWHLHIAAQQLQLQYTFPILLLSLVILLSWLCTLHAWPPTFPCDHVSCTDSLG